MEHWQKIDAVQRMQDYIQAHLDEPIALEQLSAAAGYSSFHSLRIFRELTGRLPQDYIRSLKLSRAALLLRDTRRRVLDIALDCAFDTHEGFTRAFSRQFNISPQNYRRKAPPVQLFMPSSVREYHLYLAKGEDNGMSKGKEAQVSTVFVQVVEKPARRLLLKRAETATHYFEYCQEAGCDVWGLLCSVKGALGEPIGVWLPEHMVKPGTSVYCQGVEVPADYAQELPAGFDIIDLPACYMMVFQGPPFADEDFEDAISIVWKAMEDYKPEQYGWNWADADGPRYQLAPEGKRGYIEARPARRV